MSHFVVLNGTVRFDGDCENTRPFCGSVCCKNTLVFLTTEETQSGKYDSVEPTEGCNCRACQLMRERKSSSLRRKDTGCVYLDGMNKCSIYEDRPRMCREYKCESTWWNLSTMATGRS